MVTFQEIYEVEPDSKSVLNTEGLFVVPITWLYLMATSGKITMYDSLFEENNFTDQMLVDLLIEFRNMDDAMFNNSVYNGLVVAWCNWKGDKKWRAFRDSKGLQTLRLTYQGKRVNLMGMRFYCNSLGALRIQGPNIMNPTNATEARVNLAYAEVLQRFSKNVSFNEIHKCKKILLMS